MNEEKTKTCKHCKTQIPKGAKVCPNCQKKQGGKLKWLVIIVVVIAVFKMFSGGDSEPKTDDTQTASDNVQNNAADKDAVKEETAEEDKNIPTEYKSALKKAKQYDKTMHMSKLGLYDQLTSEYGEQFPAEAAQYAVDNLDADYNANALAKADDYNKSMHMSKLGIYDQLVSESGEQFTAEEAQYAVDNLEADYNANALAKAKDYQESMAMSIESIRDQLCSEYGERFTEEEAEYAVSNLQ